jgi:predicted secreted Zn-dependent protease
MTVPSSSWTRPLAIVVGVILTVVLLIVAIRFVPDEGRRGVTQEAGGPSYFADDFSSRSGWATFSSKTAGLAFSGGGYRLNLDRPGDDGLSILILPGKALPSVAASTVVVEQSSFGGLIGVGCADGRERAYLGAVDPAGEGFVILRAGEAETQLLRYGLNEEGTIHRPGEENELQLQCTVRAGGRRTAVRLFANGSLLASYEDPDGLGPFKGVALGGVSLRRPLEAIFERVALQSLPSTDQSTSADRACDRIEAVASLENDYRWLVDSGGTSVNSPDVDARHVVRIARELRRLSTDLLADARAAGTNEARRAVQALGARLRAQGDSLNSLTNTSNRGPVDAGTAGATLGCRSSTFLAPPYRGSHRATGVPARANVVRKSSRARDLDRRLIGSLPAPEFTRDETPPIEPNVHVDVDLTYRSFRVFGASLAELDRSLRVHALRVEGEHAAGVTDSRFEWTYQPLERESGCTLVPGVTLTVSITLPSWKRPVGADRYLRNQWNQFLWALDDHERHHTELWIKAANRMIAVIQSVPPGPSCSPVVETAKARVAEVFNAYDRRQRAFDRDVAAGRLPGPSLP